MTDQSTNELKPNDEISTIICKNCLVKKVTLEAIFVDTENTHRAPRC